MPPVFVDDEDVGGGGLAEAAVGADEDGIVGAARARLLQRE